jgi:hypothetical protein
MRRFLTSTVVAALLLTLAAEFSPGWGATQAQGPAITSSPENPSADAAPSFSYASTDSQSSFECQLDGGGYVACPGSATGSGASGTQSYSGLVDGSHTFDVRGVDSSGPSPASRYTWTIDLEAPLLSLPAPITVQSPLGRSRTVSYQVIATDNHDPNPDLFCDPGRTGGTFPLGTTTVHCSATDWVGNSATGSFTVAVVDTTPPKAPAISPRPANPSADVFPALGYSTNEPAAFRCSLDGALFASCASPTSFAGLADGSHTFAVYAIDTSDNVGPTATYTWLLDTVAPALTVPESLTVESPTGEAYVAYAIGVTDNHDPNPTLSCNFARTGDVFAVGTSTVSCLAFDWVGNSASASFTVTVEDHTPPDAPTLRGPGEVSGPDVSFFYSTNERAGFECSLDEAPFTACADFRTDYGGLADGPHTFAVRATDTSGNTGAGTTSSWLVDTVAPVISTPTSVTAESPRGEFVQVSYEVSATDNHDPHPQVSCNHGRSLGYFPLGTSTVTCFARDWVGNVASASFAVIVEDRTPPDAPRVFGPGEVSGANVFFSYFSNEQASFECSLDEAPFSGCPFGFGSSFYSGLSDGRHSFAVRPTDTSGNTGPATSIDWLVDTVAPVISTPTSVTAESPRGEFVQVSYEVSAADNHDPHPQVFCDRAGLSLGFFPLGTSTVRCFASDWAGNFATASFTVTVEDHTPPDAPTLHDPGQVSGAAVSFFYFSNERASLECSLDEAPFTACADFRTDYSGLSDGPHTFAVRATDTSGNTGPATSTSWLVDATAPTLTVPDPITAESPRGEFVPVSYDVSATDNHDPQPQVFCDHGRSRSFFGLGTTTVTCFARDWVGNSASASFTVTVEDHTPPNAPTLFGPNDVSGASVFFSYFTNEQAGFECSLDEAPFSACPVGFSFYSGLEDGRHTFAVRATDTSGNTGPATSTSWLVDATSPTLSVPDPISVESPRGEFVQVTYEVSATDNHDPHPQVFCERAGVSLGFFELGTTTVTCHAFDWVGNSASASFTVTVEDHTPPDAPTLHSPGEVSGPSVSLFYSANERGSFECSLDEAPFTPCADLRTDYSALSEGRHTFAVRVTDSSGNIGPATSTSWLVDATAPVLNVPDLVTAESPRGEFVRVGYEVSALDNHDPQPDVFCDHGRSFDFFPLGTSIVTCFARDWVGNSASASFTVTVEDHTPPNAPTLFGPGLVSGANVSFFYFSNEQASFECSLDDAPFSACPFGFGSSYFGLSDGRHSFAVRPTDTSGNTGPATSTSWLVDATPPTLSVPDPMSVVSPRGEPVQVAYEVSATDNLDPHPQVFCERQGLSLDVFPLGTTTVTCHAFDWVGNFASASFTVTVEDHTPPDAPTVHGPGAVSGPSVSFFYSTNERARFECSLDDAAFTPCADLRTDYSGLSDGPHTFAVRATDTSNNTGTDTSRTWVVDATAPALTVPDPIGAESPDGVAVAVSYLVSATDEHDPAPAVSCDHGNAAGGTFSLGTTTVTCTASDVFGNTSPGAGFTVTVEDHTPPDAPTLEAHPSDPSGDRSAAFEFSTNEDATFQCSLDDAPAEACASGVSYGPLEDGNHAFGVYAVDSSGNVGERTSYSWVVDTVAPVISTPASVAAESRLGGSVRVSYSVTASDDRDPNPSVVCSSGTRTGGSFPLGTTTVTCTATDAAGNSAAGSFSVTVADTTAPAAPAIAGPSDPSNDASPTIAYSTDEQNATFRCSLDGAEFSACAGSAEGAAGTSGSVAYSGLADGAHTFSVRAIDSSNNAGPVASHSWTIDTRAPVLTITGAPSDPSSDPAPSFSFVADEAATFECQLDEGGFAPCSAPVAYSELLPGPHTFQVRATDAAGNVGGIIAYDWTQA